VVYRSHSTTYGGFQLLKIIVFELVDRRGEQSPKLHDVWRMGRQTSIKCPAPMSPDFTSLDSFLWGYVKNFVCLVQNNDRQQTKARINDAEATVTCNMLKTTRTEVEHFVDI